ncbi:MAG TPA: hypothetical protein VHG91_17180, partial [Longimicrobium sp.]|nr:hypothetical protein [Longimicrobium sp.]
MPLSTPRRPHSLALPFAAALALAAGGCDAARVPPTGPSLGTGVELPTRRPPPVLRAWVVAGNGQTGTVASKLPAPVVVRVVDTAKRPVAGQWVHFGPVNPAADDAVSADSARTDAAGEARVEWTLGTRAGERGIVARVRTGPKRFVADTARAEARGGAPASVTLTASHPSGGLGTPVSSIVTAYVRDAYGNLSPGATVTWTVVEGGGSPSQPASTVPEHGPTTVASIGWTLGTPGPQVIRATVGALSGTAGVFLPAPEGLVLAGTTRAPGPAPSAGGVFLLDPRTGRWQGVTGSDPGEYRALAWAPSGDRVAYVEDDYVRPDLEVPATFSGSSLRTEGPGGPDPIFCACPFDAPAWSPAGTRIAARSGSGVIVYGNGAFANLGTGTLPQWSPDGARVFFLSGSELRSAAPDGSAPATHLGGVA